MEENSSSWISHCRQHYLSHLEGYERYALTSLPRNMDSFSDGSSDEDNNNNKTVVSVDSFLPDDLLERILSYLPTASIFRAGSVCKRWHDIVTSKRFLWNPPQDITQKPWYFMFTGSDHDASGFAYDPTFRKWHCIDLPDFITSQWFVSSSSGLVCFMDNEHSNELHICNPITRSCKRLVEPPEDLKFSDYIALAIYENRTSRRYNITVIRSKQVPEDFYSWDISIHIYYSETAKWITCHTETLNGWRAGDASVICDGMLYFLIHSAGGVPLPDNTRHGLVSYYFSDRSPSSSSRGSGGPLLMKNFIPAPCALTCGRLMNMREKLVMVGGIGKQDRSDVIKGIGVWVLDNGSKWREVGRMPHKFFQGFGELDDVFSSSGTGDLIYIQSYGAPLLLVFDMSNRVWKWSVKCPVAKRFPLQLFTGFCFEPRLEIDP